LRSTFKKFVVEPEGEDEGYVFAKRLEKLEPEIVCYGLLDYDRLKLAVKDLGEGTFEEFANNVGKPLIKAKKGEPVPFFGAHGEGFLDMLIIHDLKRIDQGNTVAEFRRPTMMNMGSKATDGAIKVGGISIRLSQLVNMNL